MRTVLNSETYKTNQEETTTVTTTVCGLALKLKQYHRVVPSILGDKGKWGRYTESITGAGEIVHSSRSERVSLAPV
ncbi:hypothetical protein CEXT_294461 [Caerostris extrusa]|uniref:Uncharacterized protein n=1 Tax=Caerostris extrusa TaxID=172846 RepID=A0AAV4QIF3_CAEEX|nr:hypothetical protein CEXT_294461 [Caerostris extrusa]